ncbi:MAG TPA: S41 family peptidase [Gemmataceae bacterium]|nr:S41 family peptidase [Gemmataceae bacterium]
MSQRSLVAWCLLACAGMASLAFFGASARGDDDKKTTALAGRLWAMTDLVLEQHVDPPARQAMLLVALKALYPAKAEGPPLNLSARVSGVTSREQFAALLEELQKTIGRAALDSAAEDAALNALSVSVPGQARRISPEELRIQEQIAGNRYVGTGIQIRLHPEEKLAQIVLAFPRGPARRGGAKAGDLIVKVDDDDMAGLPLNKVVERLRGEEGTPVTMWVRQPGASELRPIKMIRSVVPFDSVHGFKRTGEESWQYRVDPELPIAYLRVSAFRSSTVHELRKLEGKLQAEGCKALVLDLRNNGGGEISHVAQVADGLLDGGLMWRVRDAKGRVQEQRADRDCLFRDWPMVVLAGGGEYELPGGGHLELVSNGLLASALQDNGRAEVVGKTARYEPYLTSRVPAPNGQGQIVLATGLLERAKPGRPEERGLLRPNHEVSLSAKQREQLARWNHEQEQPEPPPGALAQPPEDPQLAKALELLRAKLAVRDKDQ